ncbi:MAG: hypothetical protein KAW88_09860, partial [Candidatus Cloacimonetes bacterium]|nr:hypothetical protein [Candidatus Cloacimonadota bacterium]
DSCKMHFIQWPDLTTNGVDVFAMEDTTYMEGEILADDFFCTETGYITDVHIWGSWSGDWYEPDNMPPFTLGIWSDQPAGPGYSQPDSLLWEKTFQSIDYTWSIYAETDGEWFYFPCWLQQIFPGDSLVFKFDFYIDEDEAFIQQDSTIYWLSVITSRGYGYDPIFGWKSSFLHWNDDAVWYYWYEYRSGKQSWDELRYPEGHPLYTESMDLAFFISSTPVPEPELDFGDAPDPTYQTLLASGGARHVVDYVTFLGDTIDTEPDGQPNSTALGDDDNILYPGVTDDEDGVFFTCPLIPGEQGAITVTTNSVGRAFLNSWIDYNADGDWSDVGEHFLIDQSLLPGIHSFYFDVPIGATIDSTYARFRFCTVAGIADTGFAPDGEVEDYRIEISEVPDDDCKMHFHQWPDTTWMGVDVRATEPIILADDFECTETGLINSIHIWGSWLYDQVFEPTFYLSIWSDDPDVPGFSQPEIELWGRFFDFSQYSYYDYYTSSPGEFWYDPLNPPIIPNADFTIWQYDFTIPDSVAFVQEQGVTYWLCMTVYGVPPEPYIGFGWKTSVNHWNDDAVWGMPAVKDRQTWYELRYPEGHPLYLDSIDFSFYINCTPTTPIVNISVSSDTVYVSWDPIPCANTYTVYSSTDPYAAFPTWTLEQAGITTTSWCKNVSGTPKKFYKVVAVK